MLDEEANKLFFQEARVRIQVINLRVIFHVFNLLKLTKHAWVTSLRSPSRLIKLYYVVLEFVYYIFWSAVMNILLGDRFVPIETAKVLYFRFYFVSPNCRLVQRKVLAWCIFCTFSKCPSLLKCLLSFMFSSLWFSILAAVSVQFLLFNDFFNKLFSLLNSDSMTFLESRFYYLA